jgi:hypothetical protein
MHEGNWYDYGYLLVDDSSSSATSSAAVTVIADENLKKSKNIKPSTRMKKQKLDSTSTIDIPLTITTSSSSSLGSGTSTSSSTPATILPTELPKIPFYFTNSNRPTLLEFNVNQLFKKDHKPSVSLSLTAEYFRRISRLIVHEIGHNYGLEHCINYHCLMNGSGNLEEDFATPAIDCGNCLRKLQFSTGFDIIHRYQQLLLIYTKNGMTEEWNWTKNRLAYFGIESTDVSKEIKEEDTEVDNNLNNDRKKIVVDLT